MNLFYPFTVSFNKCGGSCQTIDDPYARISVPNKVKKCKHKKVFDLMSNVNESGFLVQHDLCESKCRLNIAGFLKWGRLVGAQFGQNDQKLHENYKIGILGSKQWGGGG